MDRVRFRGLLSLIAGAVLIAPPWYYLWLVDYRGAILPEWGMPMIVAFCGPPVLLIMRGLYSLATGRVLGTLALRIRL